MCGIIGLFQNTDCSALLHAGMRTIQNRGQDHYGVATLRHAWHAPDLNRLPRAFSDSSALGHCLHAVVAFQKQPLKAKGVLVSNCEIYNWQALGRRHHITARNDADLLFKLLEKKPLSKLLETVLLLDGDFAFAYWRNGQVFLVRDPVGVKPVWYACERDRFAFASEAKALHAMGFVQVREQNPRELIAYDTKHKKLTRTNWFSFETKSRPTATHKKTLLELEKIFLKSVQKRLPKPPFGILFSGGLDSVVLAAACRKLGAQPLLFHTAIIDSAFGLPQDLAAARKAARALGLPLVVASANLKESERLLRQIVPIIESSDVTKAGVGLSMFLACRAAARYPVKVVLSGLGADELLGGYARQQETPSGQQGTESLSYLLKAYEKDLYRDDVISMQNNVELRVPYYDRAFISFALALPDHFKIANGQRKVILRELATRLGVLPEWAARAKKAAQYGSNADKAIAKLAKQNSFASKSAYLNDLLQKPNMRLGCLISGGKDSWLAAAIMKEKNYSLACLIALKSANPNSYMFHTPNISLVHLQSKASGIPLVIQQTKGEKEKELADLQKALASAQKKFRLDGIVNGALFSRYQRQRIEAACDKLGLKIFSPLWHLDQEKELRELLHKKFEVVFTSIACHGLNKTWLGKPLTKQAIADLVQLRCKYKINVAGEGGEFETAVLDCPLFQKRIQIIKSQMIMQNECTGKLDIIRAKLFFKQN